MPVSPPTASGSAAEACRRLTAALPDRLAGQDRRDTAPASDLTAAWGDPPVTLACGVPRPDALVATSQLVVVDGVDWLPERLSAGWRFTAVGRQAYVQVEVPSAYHPEVGPVAALSPVVRHTVPRRAGGVSAAPDASAAPTG